MGDHVDPLTPRELEVLELVGEGTRATRSPSCSGSVARRWTGTGPTCWRSSACATASNARGMRSAADSSPPDAWPAERLAAGDAIGRAFRRCRGNDHDRPAGVLEQPPRD